MLRYHYVMVPVPRPVTPLGGRFVRPRPLLDVGVMGPASIFVLRCLLDTGADDTVFPEDVAATIGLDLTGVPTGGGAGVGLYAAPLRYGQVTLRITDGREQRVWTTWVGFTPAKLLYPMLGFTGFLQFFDAHFRGGTEEVELTVNPLYPGT
jgi:hypothetical protein